MSANHSLSPGDLAELDQVGASVKADLEEMLSDPAIHESLAEDGPTVAAARLTITLEEEFAHLACAGLAAFAILRLVQAEGGEPR